MEPRPSLGYTSNGVQSQEQVFEDIYHRVQSEYGVEGIVSLVRFVTNQAVMQREQTLKNLEAEANEVKRAIDMINEVMPSQTLKKHPY
jgi:transcription initiation factor IIE alpha subunit